MLKDNFKDAIFNNNRKYRVVENADKTVTLVDATEYTQIGDKYSASDVNEERKLLNQLSSANLLINGCYQVAQRGTSFEYGGSSTSLYTFDRWVITGSNAQTYTIADGLMRIITETGKGTTFRQKVELTSGLIRLIQEKDGYLTLSTRIDAVNAHSAKMRIGSVEHTYNLIAGRNTIEHTFKVTSADLTLGYLDVVLYWIATPSTKKCEAAPIWAKLELGEIATPFVPESYAEDLMRCQRCTIVLGHDRFYATIGIFFAYDGKILVFLDRQIANMRISPTVSFMKFTSLTLYAMKGKANIEITTMPIVTAGTEGIIAFIGISGIENGTTGVVQLSPAGKILIDAEIY